MKTTEVKKKREKKFPGWSKAAVLLDSIGKVTLKNSKWATTQQKDKPKKSSSVLKTQSFCCRLRFRFYV